MDLTHSKHTNVLYVCIHNAGRSQMAEAFTNAIAARRGLAVRGLSAGTEAGERVNPLAVQVMEEIGLSLEGQSPKRNRSRPESGCPLNGRLRNTLSFQAIPRLPLNISCETASIGGREFHSRTHEVFR